MTKNAINKRVKPLPGHAAEFILPEITTFKLNAGLPVYFVKRDMLPIMSMSLVLDAGSKHDPEGQKGLLNLLSMVMDEGAGEYDALGLSDQFELIGANFGIHCDQDSLYLSLQVLADKFERGTELFSSIVIEPHLTEKDFNREKNKILTRILQNSDDAEEIANEVFEFKLFGEGNPYAPPSIGYKEDISSISITGLRDYFKKIIDPSNSFLVIVGSYEIGHLKEILNKFFSRWSTSVERIQLPDIKAAANSGALYIVDKKDSVQSEIRTGLLCYGRNEYDFYSRSILNLILGGQFTSRLNLNLREQKGFTYGIYSRFIYLKSAGYFFTTTSVSLENTGTALSEIFGELTKIRDGVTVEELEFAKSSLIRKFPSGFETYRQIASNLIGQIIHSLPEDYFKMYSERIKVVTREEVSKAAVDNIFPDELTTVITGNKEKILDQLKTVYTGEIVELDINGKKL